MFSPAVFLPYPFLFKATSQGLEAPWFTFHSSQWVEERLVGWLVVSLFFSYAIKLKISVKLLFPLFT